MPKLKILILAPLKRPVRADITASRPHVIFDLTTHLLKRDHQVAILGTGDSYVEGAQIIPVIEKGFSYLGPFENEFYAHCAYITVMLKKLENVADNFDIVHNHLYPEFLPLLLAKNLKTPMVTTIHSQMVPETIMALSQFPEAHLVAISKSQASLAINLQFDIVYNGIDTDFFVPFAEQNSSAEQSYLLFVGRMKTLKDSSGKQIDPKGVLNAIKVAEALGEKLLIVGNVEDMKFYDEELKPHLSDKIQFYGQPSKEQKVPREEMKKLFQDAKAFLFPINWHEPFGLVVAEALSCGCPVVAMAKGAATELVKDSETGFLCQTVDEMIEKVKRVGEIERNKCREYAVANFSIKRMAEEYEKLYFKILTHTNINELKTNLNE